MIPIQPERGRGLSLAAFAVAAMCLGHSVEAGAQLQGGTVVAGSIETPIADELKRDPFRPYISVAARPLSGRPDVPRTPLECCDVFSFSLVAVIQGQIARGMVEDQAGLGYTVTVGTRIGQNGGVVTEIKQDRVVIEEKYLDPFNNERSTNIELRLEPEGEEGERSS